MSEPARKVRIWLRIMIESGGGAICPPEPWRMTSPNWWSVTGSEVSDRISSSMIKSGSSKKLSRISPQ